MNHRGGPVGSRRGFFRALVLAMVSITLTTVLLETVLRLFAPQPLLHDPDAFIPDPELGARLAPGFSDRVVTTEFASTWVINEGGYRGPVAARPRTAALRIVALGDSFTFGYGVEETQAWPRLLEHAINESRAADRQAEVVNFGVGGYGTWQEAIWLERNEEALRPDLVILGFYVGNDPQDNLRVVPRPQTATETAVVTPSLPSRGERVKRWLGSRLHLYSLVSTRADELLVRIGLRRLVYPFEMEILKTTESEETHRAWEATATALHRLALSCRERRTRLVVALIPMKHQVSDAAWSRLLRYYVSEKDTFDRLRPQQLAKSLCEHEGIETFDLKDGLVKAAADAGQDAGLFYWSRDQHFNAEGHRQTARLLAGYLASN